LAVVAGMKKKSLTLKKKYNCFAVIYRFIFLGEKYDNQA